MSTLQDKLAALLKERKMSMRALSLQAGLEESAIKQILYGKSKYPRLDTLKKICSVLGCSIDYLALSNDLGDVLLDSAKHQYANSSSASQTTSHYNSHLPQNKELLAEAISYARSALEELGKPFTNQDVHHFARQMHDISVIINIPFVNMDMARWLIAAHMKRISA